MSIGECFIELFSHQPLDTATSFEKVFSGDTLNVLAMASRLGTSCGYITRVSDDPLGDYLLDSWQRLDIDTSFARQVRGFNAFEFSSPLPIGEGRKVIYREGSAASTMTPDDLEPSYVASARVLHVSAISQGLSATCRETVLEAAKIARSSGVAVSYDTNLRTQLWTIDEAREAMQEVLPYVSIIFPSHPHEPRALLGLDVETEVIEFFLSKGVETVALKCGEAGAWVGTSHGVARVPAVAPRGVMDTAGAGDTFVGGVLHGIVQGLDTFESVRWGVACAGLKVAGPSIVGQPTREEVEQCLASVQLHPV